MKHTTEAPPMLDPLKREHVHPQTPKPAAVQQTPAPEQTSTPAPENQDEKPA